jgi:hypothetical protein
MILLSTVFSAVLTTFRKLILKKNRKLLVSEKFRKVLKAFYFKIEKFRKL